MLEQIELHNFRCFEHCTVEFEKFINLPFVQAALQNSSLTKTKAHLIPVGIRSILYKDQVFAVGDAGGLVDPISGKGIPYSMFSGKFAAEIIIKAISSNDFTQLGPEYLAKLEKEFLLTLQAKKAARDEIFKNDENLKQFLDLWEKDRSSEIITKKMLPYLKDN